MVDANRIRQVYQRYPELFGKGDVDGILDLYADGARIEDPIGSELRVGKDEIRPFYESSAGSVTLKLTGPVRIAGNEAAAPMVILMGSDDQQSALDVISTMVFDDAGKIASMRAYWSFDALRPATEEDR